jgi:hypothetical protein
MSTNIDDHLIPNIANVARAVTAAVLRQKRKEKMKGTGADNLAQSVKVQDNLAHATAHCIAALLIREHGTTFEELPGDFTTLVNEHLRRDVDRNAKHEDHIANALTRLAMAKALETEKGWFDWNEEVGDDS